MNDKTAKQIIIKYLLSWYGEEIGTQLYLDNQTKLFDYHGLAWSMGKESLQFFCEFFLHDVYIGDGKAPLAAVHYEMWADMQNLIQNKPYERQCYILPRGTAKTTITMGAVIWAAVYGYKSFIVIGSAIDKTAKGFLRNIRNAVEDNKRLNQCFGTIFDKRSCTVNQEEIEFKNKTMIHSICAESSFRGRQYNNKRIELCILDDYQKTNESDTSIEEKWKRFNDDVAYAMQKDNSTLIALGTLQRLDDFYDRIRKHPSFVTKLKKCIPMDSKELDEYFNSGLWAEFYKIYSDINNPYRSADCKEFYLQHKEKMQYPMLWGEYWDCCDTALSYFGNPESFHQEMQGEIERVGNKLIKSLSAISTTDIESNRFAKNVLSVDPAPTTTAKSDYSAFCVLGQAENNMLYARKCVVKKLEFSEYIAQIVELLILYPEVTNISVEKNTYMGADVRVLREEIAKNPFLAGRTFNIMNESRTKNKDARINTVIPDINNGRIIFNEEDTEAIAQIKEFAGTKYTPHDDMIDCLTDAVEHIAQVVTVPKMKMLSFDVLGL